ncbi:MAG: hypothetical protein DBX90_03015 [Lentisphaerae bacterium]|nr:MAG: hypothetical protein DBX90_03015 [Lentisphaerota bacterium]
MYFKQLQYKAITPAAHSASPGTARNSRNPLPEATERTGVAALISPAINRSKSSVESTSRSPSAKRTTQCSERASGCPPP